MKYYYTLLVQIMAIAAVLIFRDAQAYMTTGYGLHPILAGAVVTVALVSPYMVARTMKL